MTHSLDFFVLQNGNVYPRHLELQGRNYKKKETGKRKEENFLTRFDFIYMCNIILQHVSRNIRETTKYKIDHKFPRIPPFKLSVHVFTKKVNFENYSFANCVKEISIFD